MEKILVTVIIVIELLVLSCKTSQSSDLPKPIFPVENVELKKMIEEHIYSYTILHYKQPLKINVIPKDLYRYDTPEDALIAIISSMKHLNVEDTSGWDTESSAEEQEDLKNEEYKQRVLEAWEKTFVNADFYLLRRVNRDNLVILDYLAKNLDGTEFRSTLNFRLESEAWKATNKFSSDYVSNHLISGSTRIIGGSD